MEDKGAGTRAFVPTLHVQAAAYHIEGSAKQGIANPPSVAVALKVIPQFWVLAHPQGAQKGIMRTLGGWWLDGS